MCKEFFKINLRMNKEQYITKLEDKLFELFQMITDHSLYSFLSDNERKKVGQILVEATEARLSYNK